ncbi:class I SAM-dependent methyltransferase [Candidatus Microgenomates bacterium]|nr:class I SAM-dependent methyltransferase [Candidatus Microgenomates bacterium]
MDYVRKTIFAYNSNPQKYIDKTMNMVPYDWVDKMEKLLPPDAKVLDAGCAYGRDANEFFERGFNVVGVDLSEELLAKGHNKFPKVTLKHMDVRKLEFPNETFDGVWCNAVLLHLTDPDIEKSLKEFHRVLKKDGILYTSFQEGDDTEERITTFGVDAPRFFNLKSKDDIEEMLMNAGFTLYDSERTDDMRTEQEDKKWISTISKKTEGGEQENE